MPCYLMLSYLVFFFEIRRIFSISLYPHSVSFAHTLAHILRYRGPLPTHFHNYFDLGFYFFFFMQQPVCLTVMQQPNYSLLECSLLGIQ